MAVVSDRGVPDGVIDIISLGIKSDLYFNAGFLYINITKWLAENITNRVLDFAIKNQYLSFPEQDSLNYVLDGSKLLYWLEEKWDYFFIPKKPMKLPCIPKSVIFVHYVSDRKFWSICNDKTTIATFQEYNQKTPWRDCKIRLSYKDDKKMMFYSFHKKNFIDSIIYLFKYLLKKYIFKRKA